MSQYIGLYAQAKLDIEKDDIEIIDIGYTTHCNNTTKVVNAKDNIIEFSIERPDGEPETSFLGRARFKAAGIFRHLWDNPLLLCRIEQNKIVGVSRIFTTDQIPEYNWGENILVIQSERRKGETIDDVINRIKKDYNDREKQRGDKDG